MKLLSINVSIGREVAHMGKSVKTGIFKEPVQGGVRLGRLNLDGDAQSDLTAHGGVHKAVYVYSIENYDHWKRELNRSDLAFGQFGENFTVEGMTEDSVYVGDVFRAGNAVVEVTQPRAPCYKLGIKMRLAEFPKMFLASHRVGFYLRVLQEGEVSAGDTVERIREGPEQITIRELTRLLYFEAENLAGARRALRIPALSPGWRGSFEKRLAKAGVPAEEPDHRKERAKCCGP